MNDPLLSIRNLTIRAGDKTLVKDISLDIPRRSIMGLVGESGSGKTMTALSIMGLLPPGVSVTGGKILLQDKEPPSDLLSLSSRQLNRVRGNRISMIFQEPMTSLNPTMKCGPQAIEPLLKEHRVSHRKAKAEILRLFREVRLPDEEHIYHAWPHELSGGQRQRVMIAMALSTSPDLLIADEPTTALDVTVQKNILALLSELRDTYNLGILFITHDLMVLKQIADQIAVMYGGEILETGETKKLLEDPVTPYAKGLLACRPRLDEKPERLPTVADFLEPGQKSPTIRRQKKTTGGNEVLMTVKDLEVEFKGRGRKVKAVDRVSFDVYKGETLGLVGESGCGKTTLGRTILQLINAKSGSVIFDGTPLHQMKPSQLRRTRRRIQIVFQDPYSSLNPGKTIGNILTEPMVVHQLESGRSSRETRARELLEQVGLPNESYNLYPHQFSGGQRQRIGIARALACRPDFIILDESVSALDVSVQAQILNLLNDLKSNYDLTYIFISHDLTVVKYMSDRVMVMSEGSIVESGTSEKIYLDPGESYTRKLIAAIPAQFARRLTRTFRNR